MLPTPTDWVLSQTLPASRIVKLKAARPFAELVARIRAEAVISEVMIEDATTRSAPAKTVRASFKLRLAQDTLDFLHNGIAGLRAHYWASPEMGDAATAMVLSRLKTNLLSQIPDAGAPALRSKSDTEMDRVMVVHAMTCTSAKVWIDESQLRSDGEALIVPRWERNETDQGNPQLWRWTPRPTLLDVKTAWLTGDGNEWIAESKRDRANQIHRWGFS